MRSAFEDQEARVLRKLRSAKARRGTRHWDYGDDYDPTIEKKDLNPRRIFNVDLEADAFVGGTLDSVATVYHSFGEATAESLGVAYNLRDERVAADLLERENRLRGTVQTTWEKVQEAIIDGEAEGEGIDKIAGRIGNVFTQAKGYRARMIARTETIGASNAGSLRAAIDSGVVGKKRWLAASDHRTRTSHAFADGQTVDVDKPFQVGASQMMHPGDPAGGAEEVVNCRCSMTYVRSAEERVPVASAEPTPIDVPARAARAEAAIKQAKREGLETHKAYKPTHAPREGFYTHDRLRQQEEIIEEFLEAAKDVPEEGKAVFSGGLGGAGKGTVLRSDLVDFDPADFLTVDPDAIKEAMAVRGMIPKVAGFDDISPMELSALVHEESSHIAARLATRAQATRKNMIYDITMSSERSVAKRLELLRQAGYDDVEMVFVDIPVETSVTRALARYEEGLRRYDAGEGFGGRYVPPDIIRSHVDPEWGSVNRRTFETLKDRSSRWTLVDNRGDAPVIIQQGQGSSVARLTRSGIPLDEALPQGLSKAEAAAWFERKWGKVLRREADGSMTEIDRVVNFGNLSKSTQEDVIRAFDSFFTRAPKVADRIPVVGTMTFLKGERLLRKVGRGVQGVASRRSFLGFGSKNRTALAETAELNKAAGWWSTGDGMHVYAHEFGHHVHYTVEEAMGFPGGNMRRFKEEIIDPAFQEASGLEGSPYGLAHGTLADRSNVEWARANLSKYGMSNPYETAAESWAEYILKGDEARPFAAAVGRRMEDALSRLSDQGAP